MKDSIDQALVKFSYSGITTFVTGCCLLNYAPYNPTILLLWIGCIQEKYVFMSNQKIQDSSH